ncbi:Zinc finger NHR/GATA-type [Penicillium atrosanguineum]|nr:Zinc finger NHR/GATA-type [Penicillium atrosanguineum]
MGSLEAAPRHRDPLPAIGGFIGKDSGFKHPVSSPIPLHSSSMYSGQQLPYSYASTTNAPSQPGYISPPESRRTIEDEKDKATPRQSLPSIHEALDLPYPAPTSAPQSQSGLTAPPSHLVGRSGEGPSGPPNPFSNGPASGSLMRESGYPHQNQLQAEASRNSLASINTADSRNPSLHTLSTGKSPTQSAKTGITSVTGSQNSSGYDRRTARHTPPAPYDNRYMSAPRVDEVKGGFVGRPIPGQPHSDSVKRHLDVYDVETSLNEISEMSTRTLDFSRHYAARAHQTQRSGPILGSLPSLGEVEDMLHMQRRNQDALIRIRTAVVNQEQALAEQLAQRKAYKPGKTSTWPCTRKSSRARVDSPERTRKNGVDCQWLTTSSCLQKAAPPGRCHSCNRAETPEWRRGPDGARTLCNACGLHYAKLTRKMGANKAATLGSNLKPKTLDSASPTSH